MKKTALRDWILEEWGKANKFISGFLPKPIRVNEDKRIRFFNLNDYGICQNPGSKFQNIYIQENVPDISSFEGIDRAKFTLIYQSDKTEECKKSGGEDVSIDILFLADGENRNNLLGLSIKTSSIKSGETNYGGHEHFEVKVSPELRINKIK